MKKPIRKPMTHGASPLNRRRFLARTGAATLAWTIVKPEMVRGTQANEKIRLGLVGCGGRGTWIAQLFHKHGGYELVAGADYFSDRVEAFGEKFQVPSRRLYTGLMGYQRMLDDGVDAIAVESPPYFHPEQAAAGIRSGVHVYLAKPVAVDAPGCRLIGEMGRQATAKNLCFLVDFQTRADPFYLEALQRVHDGAIGDFAFGEASYHAGEPFTSNYKYLIDDPSNPENRLRAWGIDRTLSGDIITEQNIHTLDVASWIMDEPPIHACGGGGQTVRLLGNCFDHFTAHFQYNRGIGVTFSSRQFNGHGSPGGILNRMFGSQGVLETAYGGQVIIRGENFYRGGKSPEIYREGAVANIAEFYRNIQESNFSNTTVPPSVRSTLVTILGRTAAYRQDLVTWSEIVNSTEHLNPDLRGLKV